MFRILILQIIFSIKTIFTLSLINLNNLDSFGSSFYKGEASNKYCQTGLREDNTNYIYCARQNLTKIPNLFETSEHFVSSIVYDELVLSDNLITFVDQNSLNIKVKKLYLDSNPIHYIDHNAFDHVRNYLQEIYFDFKLPNPEESLSVDHQDDLVLFEHSVFQSCFNLRVLSIKSYKITHLAAFKLQKLNKIESLTFSNVKLKSIDKNAFIGLEQSLSELNLDSNLLDSIPSESIQVLKKLKRLNLAQNRIKLITANSFFRFSGILNSLDLSYNYLNTIDQNGFNGPIQNSLKTLYLRNNELKWPHFINLLFNLRQLEELNIDFNKLFMANLNNRLIFSHETNNSIDLKLTSLSMQGNGLTDSSLSAMMDLYDYDSVLGQESKKDLLRMRMFKYSNLVKFNLARNKIKILPIGFFRVLKMSNLKNLILDRNSLNSLAFKSDIFSGCEKSLQSLSLSSSNLEIITNQLVDSLNMLKNLQVLKLNSNSFRSINSLSTLKLESLNSLELQNNNLIELPNNLFLFKNLTDLDLSSNRLKTLNLTSLSKSSIKQLNLNNNPLRCDCNLKELKHWLNQNYDRDLLENIRWKCSEPFELSSRYFNMISLEELTCKSSHVFSSSSTTTTITSTTTLFITKEPPSNEKFRLEKSSQIILESNYILLIIGVSLGASLVCLVFLLAYYGCIINSNEKSDVDKMSKFFSLAGSDKYENKNILSPLSSITLNSSSLSYASSNSMDMLSAAYLNNLNKMANAFPSQNQYDKPNKFEYGSKSNQEQHIYHEISQNGSILVNNYEIENAKHGVNYQNNLNYALINLNHGKYLTNTICDANDYNGLNFFNKHNSISSNNQNKVFYNFGDSLIV